MLSWIGWNGMNLGFADCRKEYISHNKLAFPNLTFIESKHNPPHRSMKNIENRLFQPMSSSAIGPVWYVAGKGCEVVVSGKLVSAPEYMFWNRSQAQDNCKFMFSRTPS